jgi:hypothetical protein
MFLKGAPPSAYFPGGADRDWVGIGQRRHRPIVNDQRIHLPQRPKLLGIAAVGPSQFKIPKQLRGSCEVAASNSW